MDLISSPGVLSSPLAFLQNQSLPTISSPLRLPELNLSRQSSELGLLSVPENCKAAKAFGCELAWQRQSFIEQGKSRFSLTT